MLRQKTACTFPGPQLCHGYCCLLTGLQNWRKKLTMIPSVLKFIDQLELHHLCSSISKNDLSTARDEPSRDYCHSYTVTWYTCNSMTPLKIYTHRSPEAHSEYLKTVSVSLMRDRNSLPFEKKIDQTVFEYLITQIRPRRYSTSTFRNCRDQ